MEPEIWKPVVGYEGLYEVSNLGRVKSKIIGPRNKDGELILSGGDVRGYRQVILCKDGKHRSGLVHRLVALAFIGEPPDSRSEVNHKNFDKADNRPGNLEWLSSGDNNRHSAKVIPRLRGEEIAWSNKLTAEQVLEIRARYIPQKVGINQLAREYGVSGPTIHAIIHRRKWAHLP